MHAEAHISGVSVYYLQKGPILLYVLMGFITFQSNTTTKQNNSLF